MIDHIWQAAMARTAATMTKPAAKPRTDAVVLFSKPTDDVDLDPVDDPDASSPDGLDAEAPPCHLQSLTGGILTLHASGWPSMRILTRLKEGMERGEGRRRRKGRTVSPRELPSLSFVHETELEVAHHISIKKEKDSSIKS
jgi:hypothetical protein